VASTARERVLCIAVAALVLALLTACGAGSSSDVAATPTPNQTAAASKVQYPHTKYIYGTITALPDALYYTAELKIDGEDYSLADVWTNFMEDCGDIDTVARNAHILDIMRKMVPVGTKVVGLLAKSSPRSVYLHVAPGGGPSVNEVILRSGWASVNQWAAKDYDPAWAELTTYHQAAVEAEAASKSSDAGGWAKCRQAAKLQEARYAKEAAELSRQIDQWDDANRSGDVDVHIDWGNGTCTTCRIARRTFNFFR